MLEVLKKTHDDLKTDLDSTVEHLEGLINTEVQTRRAMCTNICTKMGDYLKSVDFEARQPIQHASSLRFRLSSPKLILSPKFFLFMLIR